MPSKVRLETTSETLFLPGCLGQLVLGPIAAFVVAGAGASTYTVQTEFDPRGFWGPFVGSIPAGVAATYVLGRITKDRLDRAGIRLLKEAEEVES